MKFCEMFQFKFIKDLSLGCCYSLTFMVENTESTIQVIKLSIDRQKFIQEIECYNRLKDITNIVKVNKNYTFSINIDEYLFCIYAIEMNYYECLGKHLADGFRFKKIEDIIYCIISIVKGVRNCHNANIIHCDIKPFNIFFDKKNFYLGDFDHSLISTEKNICIKRSFHGTLYSAPEVILENKILGVVSDIYSIGVILYELLTGELLGITYTKDITEDILRTLLNERKIEQIANTNIPDSLWNIICKCCATDFENRYKTCEDILIDLKRIPKDCKIT